MPSAPSRLRPELCLVLLLGGTSALAQYGAQTVRATPVFVFEDQIPAGAQVTYQTRILTNGGDTVLHVLENAPPFRQLAASDDCDDCEDGDDGDDGRHGHSEGEEQERQVQPSHRDPHHDETEGEHGEAEFTKRGLSSCVTVKVIATTVAEHSG